MRIRMLLLLTGAIHCATTVAADDPFRPAPAKVGAFDLTPELGIREEYDGNYYHQAFNTRELQVQVVTLKLKAVTYDGPHEYAFNYKTEAGFIDSGGDDDYLDQLAALSGHWDLGTRHRFELTGRYLQDHDRRGTEYFQGRQALLIDEPPRYQQGSMRARYFYGADGARGHLVVELQTSDKTYTNLRELTAAGDRTLTQGRMTFYARLAGSLRALLETTQGRVNYHHDPLAQPGIEDRLDSDFARYLAGLTWKITGKTSGTIKVGRAVKHFTDRDREDFSGSSWSGELQWSPLHYSTFLLTTGRQAEESNGRGDYIDATAWGTEWRHHWAPRIQSRVYYSKRREIYKGDPQGRDDIIARYGFSIDYSMRRWLTLGLFYRQELHQSTLDEFDYPLNVAGLTLNLGL